MTQSSDTTPDNPKQPATDGKHAAGGAARKSRDSSLYQGMNARQKQARDPSAETPAPADALNSKRRDTERNYTFVLAAADPEVVPVEHKAVINELTASLDSIDADRKALEQQLAGNNSANKLQIAQIKGRLADLRRRKLEIEELLRASSNSGSEPAAGMS